MRERRATGRTVTRRTACQRARPAGVAGGPALRGQSRCRADGGGAYDAASPLGEAA